MSSGNSSSASYVQILRSSSILGSAQAINYAIGLVRVKVVALLLGPSGVGLVGLYMSVVGAVQTVAQLGISDSGVREVAAAAGKADHADLRQTAVALRRVCWFTGVFGWLLAMVFSVPLSKWVFDSPAHAWAIAILGAAVLFEVLAGGQKALLQGVRRIGDLARIGVYSAILSTIVAIAVYYFVGERGIVPVLLAVSAIQLAVSWFFSRKVAVSGVEQKWYETWRRAQSLIKLGAPFMYGAVLGAGAGLAIRGMVVRELGLDAAGIYQAAWALSGMFGAFVLQALGTDFFPRLTAACSDNTQANRLINEQIEVGVLLALPPSLFAIAASPVLVWAFYSSQFLEAAQLIPWFVLGVFFQVVGWPSATTMPAKGASGWMWLSKTHGAIWQIGTVVVLLPSLGLVGVAGSFAVYTFAQLVIGQLIAKRLTGFRFAPNAVRLITKAGIALASAMIIFEHLPSKTAVPLLAFLFSVGGFLCLRALSRRLGDNHPLSRFVRRFRSTGGGRCR
jgi:antigen flippase